MFLVSGWPLSIRHLWVLAVLTLFQYALYCSSCSWIPGDVDPIYTTVDNVVQMPGIWHDQTLKFFRYMGNDKTTSALKLRIRVLKGDVTSVNVKVTDLADNMRVKWISLSREISQLYATVDAPTEYFEYWVTDIPASSNTRTYRFQVNDGFSTIWYDQCGPTSWLQGEPTGDTDFQILPSYHPPEWATDAIYYQMIPDRFHDGDKTNNKLHTPRNKMFDYEPTYPEWGTLPENPSKGRDFFGGDLVGIESKLDYIQDLGANTIFLNPVFTASTNHRYDAIDFWEVDPMLGGDDALKSLIHAAHTRGMRVILDAALTAVSSDHPWFNKYGNVEDSMKGIGAYKNEQIQSSSAYGERFIFDTAATCKYYAWGDNCDFPKMNYNSEQLWEDMVTGSDSVLKRWMRAPYEIDGWRFDSVMYYQGVDKDGKSHEVVHKFMESAYNEIKTTFGTEKIVFGELDFRTSDRPYLSGNQMDAVHNYNGFLVPMIEYVWGNVKASEYLEWVWGVLAENPFEKNHMKWNHISTHDMIRFRSVAGMGWLYEGTILQMTMVGSPMIYYGDEIGMEGGDDPDNRRTFEWEQSKWNTGYRAFVQELVQLRKNHTALQRGGFMPLVVHDTLNYFAYARTVDRLDEKTVIVIANSNHETRTISVPVWLLSIPDGSILQNRVPPVDHSDDDALEDWRKQCYRDIVQYEQFVVSNGHVRVTVCGEFGAILTLAGDKLVQSNVLDIMVMVAFSVFFPVAFLLSIIVSLRT